MDIESKSRRKRVEDLPDQWTDQNRKDLCGTIPTQTVLLFLVGTLAAALLTDFFQADCKFTNWPAIVDNTVSAELKENENNGFLQPTYAIFDESGSENHLKHVKKILQRLGYRRDSLEDDWTLLWAHNYPFRNLKEKLKSLQPYQIINHFPGCGFITSKVELSTTLPRPSYLPPAFRLPQQRQDFLSYINQTNTTESIFVVKSNSHRDISIRNINDIDLESNETFVQEFIQKPFLVDGYKFDIGVYVAITSINPLRIYFYTGDVLLRFCSIPYYPFDSNVIDKYVVGDDYLPIWQVPSLSEYYNTFEGNMRESLNAYILNDMQQDPQLIWAKIEDVIQNIIQLKEHRLMQFLKTSQWNEKRNFFELIRFDLIIDENFNVHLMEANMSPNLSSAHFKENALLYEQVLYSVMNLVNIGSSIKRVKVFRQEQNSLSENSQENTQYLMEDKFEEVRDMITSSRNLVVNLQMCSNKNCHRECRNPQCNLCLPCLSGSEYAILETAHREQLHRVNMKRLYPKPIINPENFDIETEVQNMTRRNAWLTRWYYRKCLQDILWCH